MKKRLMGVMLSVVLVAALIGCGAAQTDTGAAEPQAEEKAVETVAEPTPEPTPTVEELIEEAMNEGKSYYYAEDGKTVDMDKAMEAFRKAADLGSAEGYYYIGRIHERAEEYEEAKASYDKAVDMGSSLAKFAIGEMYLREDAGLGVDYDKAKALFEEAVADGCVEANVGLGDMYQMGYGVDEDQLKAIEYFEKAAAGQDKEWLTYAYGSLCSVYAGSGDYDGDMAKLTANAEKVVESCKDWNPEYILWAADTFYDIDIVDQAIEYYQMAGDLGVSDGYDYLGHIYASWGGQTEEYKDPAKAIEYYEKAAGMDNSDAMVNLAIMYRDGIGVDEDLAKTAEWYEKAAALEDKYALNELAYMYQYGEGVDKNMDKAIELFNKGVELGDPQAMYNLGSVYYNGDDVEQDIAKAGQLLVQTIEAAEEDSDIYKEAVKQLKKMIKNGEVTEADAASVIGAVLGN